MEMKVPLNYTGSIKRRLTTKKLEKYYYIIDYYENGKLAKHNITTSYVCCIKPPLP